MSAKSSLSYPMLQCKMLDLNVLNHPGPKRVAITMHADESSFKQAIMVYLTSLKKIASLQEPHTHKQLLSKITLSPLLNAVGFCVRYQPATHAPPSINKTTSSRPPFFVEVGPPSITPANHFRQLFSGTEPTPDACLAFLECSAKLVSDFSCDPWSMKQLATAREFAA